MLNSGSYQINRFSYNSGGSWVYANPTAEPNANNAAGLVHLGGSAAALCNGVSILGVNNTSTIITSLKPGYSFTSILSDATAAPTTLQGGAMP